MMVAAAPRRRFGNRAEQLDRLRQQLAAVSGKEQHSRYSAAGNNLPPVSETALPIPRMLSAELPAGLPRGTVAVLSGARSLALHMVAAVTAAGGNAAIVGQPDIGLLATAEMGADLSRLAVIPDPGADPVEVAAVLIDGMDLVLLGLGGYPVPAARARTVLARARHRGCALLVTGGDWPGAALRLDARVRGYETTVGECGFGRISAVRLDVCARGRAIRVRTG